MARNVWDPAGRRGIEIVATPLALSVPTPMETESSEKVTNPVGACVPPFETVAEITTGVNVGMGFWLEETTVVVGAFTIMIATEIEALPLSFELPL